MMIVAGGYERCLLAISLLHTESQYTDIKLKCAIYIGYFQVNMTDARA